MKAWLWRAWNAKRERICDCGIAHARTRDTALSIAIMCAGGPHREKIVEFTIEEVA